MTLEIVNPSPLYFERANILALCIVLRCYFRKGMYISKLALVTKCKAGRCTWHQLQLIEIQDELLNLWFLNTLTLLLLIRERTIPTDRSPVLGEVRDNFVAFLARRIPYGRYLDFLDRNSYFPIAVNCTHEAEWTSSRLTTSQEICSFLLETEYTPGPSTAGRFR
jgi:hypothetical protein